MKNIINVLAVFSIMAMMSCTESEKGRSTNVDTVNVKGEAPVQYSADDPNDPRNSVTTPLDDTGRRANTIGDFENPDSVER